ncbi:YraN family protein [Bradyrhizobium tropiciagri]|uniref:YraN family protein n=1 Tax=Bradyrhizobium tropiciagri TaxID=312253 RepID=UPI003D9B689E
MPARSNSPKALGTAMAKTDSASPERVAAFRTGISAESRAAALLIAKGYRILAKRFRTPYGEIDLVARRRNLVVFVEVKARASLDDAAYAVTPRQQQRIINAAQAWLMAHPEHAEFDLRFDAVLIAPKSLPRHLLAAFDASP